MPSQVAYDILSPVRSMASEAEIISVLDKILDSFPGLHKRHEWEFHISHQAGTSANSLLLLVDADSCPFLLQFLISSSPKSLLDDAPKSQRCFEKSEVVSDSLKFGRSSTFLVQ